MRYKLTDRTFIKSRPVKILNGKDETFLPQAYYEIFDWSKDAEITIVRTYLTDDELLEAEKKPIVLESNNLDDFY